MVGRGLQGQSQGQQPDQDFVSAVTVPELCVSPDFLAGLSPREALDGVGLGASICEVREHQVSCGSPVCPSWAGVRGLWAGEGLLGGASQPHPCPRAAPRWAPCWASPVQ